MFPHLISDRDLTQCLFSGVKNADENELRSIASDPDEIHMYNVADFSFLVTIVDDLTVNLCNSVKGSGTRIDMLLNPNFLDRTGLNAKLKVDNFKGDKNTFKSS